MRTAHASCFLVTLIAAPVNVQEASRRPARAGDTAWVIVHHVAGEKRAQYEKWMTDVLYKTR
jgi:hypothetical protein